MYLHRLFLESIKVKIHHSQLNIFIIFITFLSGEFRRRVSSELRIQYNLSWRRITPFEFHLRCMHLLLSYDQGKIDVLGFLMKIRMSCQLCLPPPPKNVIKLNF